MINILLLKEVRDIFLMKMQNNGSINEKFQSCSKTVNSVIFNDTRRRFIYISMGVVMLSMIIFSGIILFFFNLRLYTNVDNQINIQKNITQDFIDGFNSNNATISVKPLPHESPPPIGGPPKENPKVIIFIYYNDVLAYTTPNIYFQENETPVMSIEINKLINFTDNGYRFRGFTIKSGEHKAQIIVNIDSEKQSLINLFQVLAISFFVLLFISYGLARYLTSKALEPIRNSYAKQVFFVQDASHEMRTPLAIIKGKAELLATHPFDTIEKHSEVVSQIMSEIISMERMNRELLLLSKEDVDTSIKTEPFLISKLSDEIKESFQFLAESQRKKFSITIPEDPIVVMWDYQKIKQALAILLDNAFKYTSSGDEIKVIFKQSSKDIIISVYDNGIGIKQTEMSRIFDRFYRSDEVRAKNIDGSGLGLSILKSLSRILGFKINIETKEYKGTVFKITIPQKLKSR
jgi:two-component system, OmpR family, sensor histidine kinase CiaH